ncbi:MAG: hypothetical protein A3G18_12150 [Rhodospirillales bacterium RIFCSPLOWO2_12_FULL_58_28]|nr:MAG: hypothetical protein A3H92_12165 [Rhodospirillales bacterium RIFCSPLOWO2_02_FULL_58_16]OHC79617.1 MAG: hypothetical protein A3G18_12150 [Rhodospirillales bacterium RIFCSPLOWO2_12_FULL_58_28]
MLSAINPLLAFAVGVVGGAAPLAAWMWRRRKAAKSRLRHLSTIAEVLHEILAAAPDGLFLWDHAGGKVSCSRRMAVLLDLPEGANSGYADIIARFEDESAAALEGAVNKLRREGNSFELLLTVRDALRRVHVLGVRAGRADGSPLADLLWMRYADAPADTLNAPNRMSGVRTGPLKSLIDVLPFPVWLRDASMEVVIANIACSAVDVTGPVKDMAMRVKREGKGESERHLLTVGETPRLFEVTEIPLEGWEGTAGFAVDRTAIEKMEGEFARHDAARDQVLKNLTTAIAIFGEDARLKFFNAAYAELWGLDPKWLDTNPSLGGIMDRLRELRRLPEVADFRAFKEERLALFNNKGESTETLMHLPDGTTVRAVVGPHSQGGLVFSYEDVSDRLDLERSFNNLAAVQRETLDHLYEGLAVFGSDGRLRLSNPVFAKLWNLNAGDLEVGTHISCFVEAMRPLLTDIEDWPSHKERVVGRLMSRETKTGRLTRNDGSTLVHAVVPLPDGAVLLSYLDISDSARVEQALRQRADALLEADRLKSEFIANVSYELRTPLTTLIGFAEILGEGYFGELNARQKEYNHGILTASRGLMTIISDILDLATIEAGKMALDPDTVDVHPMLVSVLGLIRERARHKNLKVEFDCPADIGWVVADEKRIKQVMFNLLSNAVTFTPMHGAVRVEASRNDKEVVLKVADTGVGIAKADQDRVFAAFERGSTPQPGQGSGMGLSLVKRFIELHGGRVEMKSTPAKGTVITCYLPVRGPE